MKFKTLFSFKAKVIEPCSKLLSKFKFKFEKPSMSLRAPTFRIRRRRNRPHIRTKTVRFRKPFSLRSLTFPQCGRPKTRLRLRRRRPSISSKFKKTLKIRRPRYAKSPKKPIPKVRIADILTVLFSLRKAKDLEEDSVENVMTETVTPSVSDTNHGKEPFPSPITPAYLRKSSDSKKDSSEEDSEALEQVTCRNFENYLSEMIVEEGKVKDLVDVEELLYCWRNLKNPVFIDLVSRFYGELCKDMFAPTEGTESHETTTSE